ncbi:hypothetical protein E4T49_04822 [Aureobasidium sp. EXF-10728]|nr:hypothetical protein E4T49_04822 [Aureobasidium sp. EXF-10728]
MGKNKKKRKDNAPHARRPAPSERRQVISYDDIEGEAAPPIPRQKVSYGSDSDNDDDQAPDQRHAVVSKEALKERERPQTDVTYGQVGAFPGLDPRDKDPFYGPANDGLDYLRMVRSEARGIPHIVRAPPPEPTQPVDYDDEDDYEEHVDDYGGYYEEDEEEDQDQDGWYEDGAYVAPSVAAPVIGPVQPGMKAQDAFYDSLKTRFEILRRNLRASPSVQAVQTLDDQHPISLPFGNKMADKDWKYHLLNTTPLPAQLASLDSPSILRLLKLVEGQLENCRKTNIPHNLGLWAWSLLAKLDDVGLLQTREVSVVRDLAKMAIWVRMMHHKARHGRSNDPDYEHLDNYPHDNAAQHEEAEVVDAGQLDATEAGASPVEKVEAAVEAQIKEQITSAQDDEGDAPMDLGSEDQLLDAIAAKKRELQTEAEVRQEEQKQEEFPDTNTCVTIDMLVTVASEFYGQKDLLVGRLPWEHPTD